MLLRLATFGALGYAAYNYYTKNREQVDGALRRLTQAGGDENSQSGERAELAGGPLSGDATLVHASDSPVS
jgi:hypothetical protein